MEGEHDGEAKDVLGLRTWIVISDSVGFFT